MLVLLGSCVHCPTLGMDPSTLWNVSSLSVAYDIIPVQIWWRLFMQTAPLSCCFVVPIADRSSRTKIPAAPSAATTSRRLNASVERGEVCELRDINFIATRRVSSPLLIVP